MKCVYVIFETIEVPDIIDMLAHIKTGVHVNCGKVVNVMGEADAAMETAQKLKSKHPKLRYDVVPLSLNEAAHIGLAADFETMLSDDKFMEGVE